MSTEPDEQKNDRVVRCVNVPNQSSWQPQVALLETEPEVDPVNDLDTVEGKYLEAMTDKELNSPMKKFEAIEPKQKTKFIKLLEGNLSLYTSSSRAEGGSENTYKGTPSKTSRNTVPFENSNGSLPKSSKKSGSSSVIVGRNAKFIPFRSSSNKPTSTAAVAVAKANSLTEDSKKKDVKKHTNIKKESSTVSTRDSTTVKQTASVKDIGRTPGETSLKKNAAKGTLPVHQSGSLKENITLAKSVTPNIPASEQKAPKAESEKLEAPKDVHKAQISSEVKNSPETALTVEKPAEAPFSHKDRNDCLVESEAVAIVPENPFGEMNDLEATQPNCISEDGNNVRRGDFMEREDGQNFFEITDHEDEISGEIVLNIDDDKSAPVKMESDETLVEPSSVSSEGRPVADILATLEKEAMIMKKEAIENSNNEVIFGKMKDVAFPPSSRTSFIAEATPNEIPPNETSSSKGTDLSEETENTAAQNAGPAQDAADTGPAQAAADNGPAQVAADTEPAQAAEAAEPAQSAEATEPAQATEGTELAPAAQDTVTAQVAEEVPICNEIDAVAADTSEVPVNLSAAVKKNIFSRMSRFFRHFFSRGPNR